jgi:DNA-nicking Smr family endonuclease
MTISDDEKKLFAAAMQGVKPYQAPAPLAPPKPPEKKEALKKPLPSPTIDTIKYVPRVAMHAPATPRVTGHDIIAFSKPGIQHKKIAQLKQEKLPIDATLDLHEHTSDQALIATDDFIERSQQKGLAVVRIIHGKGLFSSDNNPVLKNLLNRYLREHASVLAFHSSKHNTGSMTVLLKKL